MSDARMQFSVTKASGRLRPGQTVECDAGATLDGGPLVGCMLTGVPGPLKYYARFLPVARVHAEGVVRALSVLGHPNVIGPIGVGGVDGDVFIVQEMPEGESLDRWIQRGRATGERMKLREIEQVLRHAATALRHAHQAQIRHGSVGAGQVRVARQASGDLHVQVVDFGLLPLLATHAASVSLHEWHQLAPEQAANPANATVASDLFALGVLLVEMLTGHAYVPPAGKTPWRELAVSRPPDVRATVSRERPETPDAVLDLVATLLRAKPEDRAPATAMDLARVLPRLSWEPRAEPEVRESSQRAARHDPAPTVTPTASDRPGTMAPSRSFVVSAASFTRPASAQPGPAPVQPAPAPVQPPVRPVAVPAPPVPASSSPIALPVTAPAMPAPPAAPPVARPSNAAAMRLSGQPLSARAGTRLSSAPAASAPPAPSKPAAPPPSPAPPAPSAPIALPVAAPSLARPATPRAPEPTALPPVPSFDPLAESTFSEADAPDPTGPQPTTGSTPPADPSRSWFAPEATQLHTQAPMPDLRDDDATPAPVDGTRIVSLPAQRPATMPPGGFRSLLQTEGTQILAHPDQLAASATAPVQPAWDGTRMLELPPAAPALEDRTARLQSLAPHDSTQPLPPMPAEAVMPLAPLPVAPSPMPVAPMPAMPRAPAPMPFMQVESTMPDTVVPDVVRAQLGMPVMPPRAPEPYVPRPLPDPPREEPAAHPALLVMVVVAAGSVLGLIAWGVLHS